MKTGADHLHDWIERRGFSAQEAARYLRVEASQLSLLLSKKRPRPGLDVACRIERGTGIPVEVWLQPREEPDADEPRGPTKGELRRQHAKDLGETLVVAHAEEG